MLSGGWGSRNRVEALYGDGTQMCRLPDLPLARTDHSMHNLTVCGGSENVVKKNCQTLDSDGNWITSHTLKKTSILACQRATIYFVTTSTMVNGYLPPDFQLFQIQFSSAVLVLVIFDK